MQQSLHEAESSSNQSRELTGPDGCVHPDWWLFFSLPGEVLSHLKNQFQASFSCVFMVSTLNFCAVSLNLTSIRTVHVHNLQPLASVCPQLPVERGTNVLPAGPLDVVLWGNVTLKVLVVTRTSCCRRIRQILLLCFYMGHD